MRLRLEPLTFAIVQLLLLHFMSNHRLSQNTLTRSASDVMAARGLNSMS